MNPVVMRAISTFIMCICLTSGSQIPDKATFVDIKSVVKGQKIAENLNLKGDEKFKATDNGQLTENGGEKFNKDIQKRYKEELQETKKKMESLIDLLKGKSEFNKKRRKKYFRTQDVPHTEKNTFGHSSSPHQKSNIRIDKINNPNFPVSFTTERTNLKIDDSPKLAETFEQLHAHNKSNEKALILKDHTSTDLAGVKSKILSEQKSQTFHKDKAKELDEKSKSMNEKRSKENNNKNTNSSNEIKPFKTIKEHIKSHMQHTQDKINMDKQSSLSAANNAKNNKKTNSSNETVKPPKIQEDIKSNMPHTQDKININKQSSLSAANSATRIVNTLSSWGRTYNVIPARTVDIIPERAIDVIPARTVDVIPAKTVDVIPAETVDVIPARTTNVVLAETVDFIPARTTGILSVGLNGHNNNQIDVIKDGKQMKAETAVKGSKVYGDQTVGRSRDIIGDSFSQMTGATGTDGWVGGMNHNDALWDSISGYLYNQLLDTMIENIASDIYGLIGERTATTGWTAQASPGNSRMQDTRGHNYGHIGDNIIGNTNPNNGWMTDIVHENHGQMTEHPENGWMGGTNQINDWLNNLFMA